MKNDNYQAAKANREQMSALYHLMGRLSNVDQVKLVSISRSAFSKEEPPVETTIDRSDETFHHVLTSFINEMKEHTKDQMNILQEQFEAL